VSNSNAYLKTLYELPVINGTNLEVPTVSPDDSITQVLRLFTEKNIGALIAVEKEAPVGVITEKDIIEQVLFKSKDPSEIKIRDIMSSPVITIESGESIKNAIDLLKEKKLRRLVVTYNGKLIGITTERRLLNVAHMVYYKKRQAPLESYNKALDKPAIMYLSSYPPRECGIATFTNDLVTSIDRLTVIAPSTILAINDKGGTYNYPDNVKIQLERDERESYLEAAHKINNSNIKVLNLQHEFGLFGGSWGEYLIDFMQELDKPIISTFHTILDNPNIEANRVMREIITNSDRLIVLARVGARILEQVYETLPDKVRYIPHGCPNVPFLESDPIKKVLGYDDRIILSTFGLISRGKGIEYAIKAIPEIAEKFPNVLYLIIGQTHPEVRKHEGESYRNSLIQLAENLGVKDNVQFINRFVSKSDLITYLQATDVYILPYPNPEQISSGTMLYALCTGKAIVTTPFLHAQEVINQGAAEECKFRDESSIIETVNELLTYKDLLQGYEKRAYNYSRDMIWPVVAMRYVNQFYECM
jgi:glycosyltransferase involved in cell wall biosynthesis/CBS domain-containing protein